MVATKEQIRKIEAKAFESGLSEERLMENAGTAAARKIREIAVAPMETVILCGHGNNGGDGCVIARKLFENAYPVTVVLTGGAPKTTVARAAFSRMIDIPTISLAEEPYRAAAAVSAASLVVDAVYGIGFNGELPRAVATLFGQIHNDALRIAVDIPSGLECDNGTRDESAFCATHTVTFIAAKPALLQNRNADICGAVHTLAIGIADEDIASVLENHILEFGKIAACFSTREEDSHKGTFGHLLAICGSVGMAGAAILSARAALRSGVGLLTVALPKSIYPIVSSAVPEAVFLPLPEMEEGTLSEQALWPLMSALKGKTAVLAGCGMGCTTATQMLICELIDRARVPLILDADGLNAVSPHIDVLKTATAPLVLTPHPGEMSRLTGKTVSEIQQDRVHIATSFAANYSVTLVLKGHCTVIADAQRYDINTTGNPGMATGGSGDVLAGMIGAFAAQGILPADAARCGVYLHGLAGDRIAERYSQTAMLPSDIIEELKTLFSELE